MNKTAFSLIELLVSITIVAILSSIAVTSYKKQIRKTQFMHAINIVQECRKQVEIAFQENDEFPNNVCGLSKTAFVTVESDVLEQLHFNYDNDNIWFAATFKNSFIPASDWRNRSIHVGGTYSNSQRKLVWFCGKWDHRYLYTTELQYLPTECQTDGVHAALGSVT